MADRPKSTGNVNRTVTGSATVSARSMDQKGGTTVNENGFSGSGGKMPISPVGTIDRMISDFKNSMEEAKAFGVVPTVAKELGTMSENLNKFIYGEELADKMISIVDDAGASFPNINSGYSASGYGYSSGSGSGYSVSNGANEVDPLEKYRQIVNETTDKNNAWAAEQAQKQMDFQREMSDTAHQREVKDLIAAGLNPVLSANGGSGASTASGAMATPDTSNTRLLAEAALAQMNSLGNSAVTLASAGVGGKAANSFGSKLLNVATKYFVPSLAKAAGSAIARGIFG